MQGAPPVQYEFLSSLQELATLALAYCKLPELPSALASLPSLRSLFVHGNKFAEAQAPAWPRHLHKLSLSLHPLLRWKNALPAELERLYIGRHGSAEEQECGGLFGALRALPKLRLVGYMRPPATPLAVRESFSFLQEMFYLAAVRRIAVRALDWNQIDWR